MAKLINYYMLIIFITTACSRYPADVEQVLKLAGDNRSELEKVLEHYGQRPEDSLKLRAAYFLITNMPYHYTVQDAKLDAFKSYLNSHEMQEKMLENYTKEYGQVSGSKQIIQDVSQITAAFLIRNIDFSFRLWQETPWGKNFSFDVFCEEILPYRISHEPLEHWKEAYYAAFRPVIDTMAQSLHPEEITMKLLDYFKEENWYWERDFATQGLGALFILQHRFGSCKEQCEFITYVLRSVGIPSGIDMFIQNPEGLNRYHYWNFTRNISGDCVNFDYYDTHQTVLIRSQKRKLGTVYRRSFALQKESLPVQYKNLYIPRGGLEDALRRDVSNEYFPDTHISVRLEPSALAGKNDVAYLCIFNSKEWIPIAWSKPEGGLVLFRNLEPNLLYQIRLIDQTSDMAVSKPFIYYGNDRLRFLDADTTNIESMTLLRKFKLQVQWHQWIHHAVGGQFQGANRPDFSDAVTLHTIDRVADMSYVFVTPEQTETFKYVRFLSSPGGFNNMAEVRFYSGGQHVTGKVIGTDGSKDVFPDCDKYSVFDDDPLTFFDALEPDGAWSGLELDKAHRIDAIRYIFRNDDNHIRPGDTYELLYYSGEQWLSAGRQTADTLRLIYRHVPANTLYWLRNHTRGKEESLFTYENDRQVWW